MIDIVKKVQSLGGYKLQLRFDLVRIALAMIDTNASATKCLFMGVGLFCQHFFSNTFMLLASNVCVSVIHVGKMSVTLHTIKHAETGLFRVQLSRSF